MLHKAFTVSPIHVFYTPLLFANTFNYINILLSANFLRQILHHELTAILAIFLTKFSIVVQFQYTLLESLLIASLRKDTTPILLYNILQFSIFI